MFDIEFTGSLAGYSNALEFSTHSLAQATGIIHTLLDSKQLVDMDVQIVICERWSCNRLDVSFERISDASEYFFGLDWIGNFSND